MCEVFVFKTNVISPKAVTHLTPYLNQLLSEQDWNFDLEDCDKILRIAGGSDELAGKVKNLLHESGYTCEELE